MYKVGSTLVAAAVFAAAAHYFYKVKLGQRLALQSLGFAIVAHVVMRVYHHYFGYEHMTTFGATCPNGYQMVDDPANPQQQTCVPVGHPTSSPSTGFRSEKQLS